MKVKPLETHDRLSFFEKDQNNTIVQGIEDCLKRNRDAVEMQKYFPYIYILAHPRTDEDGVTKRMLWQPRLTKPKADTNSYLFRCESNTNTVEIIWIIPPKELWSLYQKDKFFENEIVAISIYKFMHQRDELNAAHKDDWNEDRIKQKLQSIQGSAEVSKASSKILPWPSGS